MAMTRRGFLSRAGMAASIDMSRALRNAQAPAGEPSEAALRRRDCRSNHRFSNWAGTLKFKPSLYCEPKTEERLVDIVKQAAQAGTCVRVQGAGHSFSQLLTTTDTLVCLDKLDRPITVSGQRVTVPAGMRLKRLIRELADRGLALRNLGSITEQSIAGAISTGTHGTGLRLGSISTQVVGVRLVTGSGEVRTIRESDARHLAAARIGIGALGVMTEVTLDCVRHYQLEYTAYLSSFDEVVAQIDALSQDNERMLLWWLVPPIGPRDKVIVITKNPIGDARGALSRARDMVPPEPPDAHRAPLAKDGDALQSLILELSAGAPRGLESGFKKIWHTVGDYDEILTLPLLPVYHRECEYAVPAKRAAEAMKALRRVIEEGGFSLLLPIEVRFVAKDDIFLSPAYGQDVCYIGASTEVNSTEVFERYEPIMKDLGGKPHWGKNFTLTQGEIAKMYPTTYGAFREIRDELDPKRVFSNSLLGELCP